jgi:hypothetical protein
LKVYRILLLILLALTFASCNPVPSSFDDTPTNKAQKGAPPMPTDNSSGNPVSPMNTLDVSEITPPPAEANPFVKLAEDDLASRLKISADQIHFLKMTDIDWQDLAQGCTTALGQTSTKGRPFGYRIWLEAKGKNYLYHVGLDNTVLFCPD